MGFPVGECRDCLPWAIHPLAFHSGSTQVIVSSYGLTAAAGATAGRAVATATMGTDAAFTGGGTGTAPNLAHVSAIA